MKKISLILIFVLVLAGLFLSACATPADVASQNVSKEADNFGVVRRIVFYNGITNDYILVITGLCSLGNYDSAGSLSVICKTGENQFKKHYLGLSDNVTYFAEQLESAQVGIYRYEVIFNPVSIVPDIELITP